ncbi:hypothetical protein [Actinoplanes sp. NPDC026619]|uniref:hypothetical protein n=1 Tax=Actinoplanes sp. NPDC026619 TaxID=3155798 RepID=UPI0033FFABF1
MHIEWASSVVRDGVTWLEAEGEELDPAGHPAGRRQILIRAERLPAPLARKRPRLRV